MEEECGAVVTKEDLKKVGELVFEFKNDPVLLQVHAYITEKWTGMPKKAMGLFPDFILCFFFFR